MKILNIFLPSLVILCFSTVVFSQHTAIGLRTGATYFTLNNEDVNDPAKYTLGVDLAIPVEFSP